MGGCARRGPRAFMNRGDIYLVSLDPTEGREQQGRRPVLIITPALFNAATKLPVVLLGGAGGQMRGGRVLDYLDKPNRKMCSLYLSLMDRFGIKLEQFGDAHTRLAKL